MFCRALVPTSQLCRSLGFLSPTPSARWFFQLGTGGLLGDEALGGNVSTLLGFFRVEYEVRFLCVSLGLRVCSHHEILWGLGKTNGFLELCALHQAQGKLEL